MMDKSVLLIFGTMMLTILFFITLMIHISNDADRQNEACIKNGGTPVIFDGRSAYKKCVKNGLIVEPNTGKPIGMNIFEQKLDL